MKLRIEAPVGLVLLACGLFFGYPGYRYSYLPLETFGGHTWPWYFWPGILLPIGIGLIFSKHPKVRIAFLYIASVIFFTFGAGIFLVAGPNLGSIFCLGFLIICIGATIDLKASYFPGPRLPSIRSKGVKQ